MRQSTHAVGELTNQPQALGNLVREMKSEGEGLKEPDCAPASSMKCCQCHCDHRKFPSQSLCRTFGKQRGRRDRPGGLSHMVTPADYWFIMVFFSLGCFLVFF